MNVGRRPPGNGLIPLERAVLGQQPAHIAHGHAARQGAMQLNIYVHEYGFDQAGVDQPGHGTGIVKGGSLKAVDLPGLGAVPGDNLRCNRPYAIAQGRQPVNDALVGHCLPGQVQPDHP